ncbi:hypothetical protein SteCoe_6312 [Stentor coeruleus]|uniref:Uncharacterized protein n=1 Tax=Stentor coeruleus TaxID=5963 RepID=A0A1R2CQ60_9CILI|nr:hypothetical protein SteCoe_6312 [Stentor coeruleus]
MLRGNTGMLGGEIYFAETTEIAYRKSNSSGATIKADVLLDYSLICRNPDYCMNFSKLINHYGYNSVKGIDCVSFPEYVVYNFAQVSVKKIWIDDQIYFRAKNKN